MKTYFPAYRNKMVAGFLPTSIPKVKRGQLITFRYPEERSRRKSSGTGTVPRLVFVLNQRLNPAGGGRLLHGLNLSHVPWLEFRTFLKRLITQDTLTLIKRRYEMKAPITEIIDRPKTFYQKYIQTYLGTYPCYRTYFTHLIKQPKVGTLNYATLFPPSNKKARDLLISKQETLKDIQDEVRVLNEVVNVNTMKLKDDIFTKLILSRFGSVDNFVEAVLDIEKYIDETSTTDMNEIDDLLK
tara:strand:- start:5020 stop:5742 length:723 start_codon:yes stop_codon:yes gene_type:complete